MRVWLRDVTDADVMLFFEHQSDRDATEMAAFESRAREPHVDHWNKIRADDTVLTQTIMVDEEVAGNVVTWHADDHREVGYWIGKEFWGRGVATEALRALLAIEPHRPLHAYVAEHNHASIAVLERCGFARMAAHEGQDGVTRIEMQLADPSGGTTRDRLRP